MTKVTNPCVSCQIPVTITVGNGATAPRPVCEDCRN